MKNENLQFRPIVDKDVLQIEELVKKIFISDFPEYSRDIKDYLQKRGLNIAGKLHIPVYTIWGAYLGFTPIGFLIGMRPFGGIAHIDWVGIVKDYQGKGIGREFVNSFIDGVTAEGAHAVHLFSSEANLPFYQKLGFENIGLVRKNYWGADDYYLVKILQEPKEENFLK